MSLHDIRQQAADYGYKLELHAHTTPPSGCSDITPRRLVEQYTQLGFAGVVLTNHFTNFLPQDACPQTICDAYLRDYYEARCEGEKRGLKVYLGMEVRFPEYANDYLVYGICEQDVKEVYSYIHSDYITFYKAFKNGRNVILQAHPFRDNLVLQEAAYLDGIEVFNVHPNHNSRVALANRVAAAHPGWIRTCGTDYHHEGHEGLGATRSRWLPEDSYDIARLLQSGDYLFDVAGSLIVP